MNGAAEGAVLHGLMPWLRGRVTAHQDALRESGGITRADLARVASYDAALSELGDQTLYAPEHKQRWCDAMEKAAAAIAVLSFLPHGLELFGVHWQAAPVGGDDHGH